MLITLYALPYNRAPPDTRCHMTPANTDYAALAAQAEALTHGETDPVANMANISALLFHALGDVNWVGFYRLLDGELVLGPFQGKPACIRIAIGRGVCGTAAASGQTQCVADVHAFDGHIACDPNSRAELVVPVFDAGGQVIAVLDIDSESRGRFGATDVQGMEQLVAAIVDKIAPN